MPEEQYKSKKFIEKYKIHSTTRIKVFLQAFKEIVGDYDGKNVLDVGCGDGSFTAQIAKNGGRVEGIDVAPKMIEECTKNYSGINNLNFSEEKAQNIKNLKKEFFDIALFSMILIHIKTEKDLKKIFRGANHVLKKDGVLVFSELNPASITAPKTEARWKTLPKNFLYLKGGEKFKSHVKPTPRKTITFNDIHWPLEVYSKVLRKTGFCITHIIEPKSERKVKSNKHEIPSYIIFGCKKFNYKK
ncbi:MAG: class I SAM-dependent methyltransferase [archaeon]